MKLRKVNQQLWNSCFAMLAPMSRPVVFNKTVRQIRNTPDVRLMSVGFCFLMYAKLLNGSRALSKKLVKKLSPFFLL